MPFEDNCFIGVDEDNAHATTKPNTMERVQSIMQNVVSKPTALQYAAKNAKFFIHLYESNQ